MSHVLSSVSLFVLVSVTSSNAQARTLQGDFDLIADQRDANGFLLNPTWRTTEDPRTLDPAERCGILGLHGAPGYRPVLLRDPDCFGDEQRSILRLNEPRHLVAGGVACGQAVDDGSPQGHLNWVPVTMEGALIFDNRMTGLGGDYDLTFEFIPDNRPPSTKWNGEAELLDQLSPGRSPIHLEFDYRVTIDRLREDVRPSWWTEFSEVTSDRELADSMLGVGRTIVTGLFNLDLVHYGHSEIHPIFGLAVLVDTNTVSQTRMRHRWAILARDRGNQGNCATLGMMPLRVGEPTDAMNTYRMRLPAPDGANGAPTIVTGPSWVGASNAQIQGPEFRWSSAEGLQLEVSWPRPEADTRDAVMMADLVVEWPGNFAPPVVAGRLAAAIDSARAIRAMDVTGLRPEYYERRSGGQFTIDSEFYADLDSIGDWNSWSATVTSVPQLPSAEPMALIPAEVFDRTPPVQACDSVKISENPRCRGNWAIAPNVGASIWDARDLRQISSGVSIENVRHYIKGPFLRIRFAAGYVWRESTDSAGIRQTEHLITVQPQLIVGPLRQFLGVYGIASAGVGALRTDEWHQFWVAEPGVGIPLRPGLTVGADIELVRTIRNKGPDFWRLSLRFPIAAF